MKYYLQLQKKLILEKLKQNHKKLKNSKRINQVRHFFDTLLNVENKRMLGLTGLEIHNSVLKTTTGNNKYKI